MHQESNKVLSIIIPVFNEKNFLEVQTPMLVNCPGMEKDLSYFSSCWQDYRGRQHELFLRSSPELHLKKLLSRGYDKIYELSSVFRNGGELATWHQPEFLMLEWYEKNLSFNGLITQTENLIFFLQEGLRSFYKEASPLYQTQIGSALA